MTTESSKNGASSLVNVSGYNGHDYINLDAYYYMLLSSRIRIRIRFSIWPVSGYACIFVVVSYVIKQDQNYCYR